MAPQARALFLSVFLPLLPLAWAIHLPLPRDPAACGWSAV